MKHGGKGNNKPRHGVLIIKKILCQENLRMWNRNTFGHVRNSLKKKLAELKAAVENACYISHPTRIHALREDIQQLQSKDE